MPEETKGDEQPQVDEKAVQAFIDAYGALVKEHNFDFAAYPVWVPDGNGGWRTVIQQTPIDVKDQPKKSPFVG